MLSWNILQGGGSRINDIIKSLMEINATIIGLSEFKNNNGGNALRYSLLREGWIHQCTGHNNPENNTVFIASKIPFEIQLPASDLNEFQDQIIKARFPAFDFYQCYFPHKKEHQLFQTLFKELKNEKAAIIMGDLNTGKNLIDQAAHSFWYAKEFMNLDQYNCRDAFRLLHGDIQEFSWYSHSKQGYRYDHCFISDEIRPILKSCYYLHHYREQGLSDHSPMILELS